jgi:hypothetical protein
VFVLLVASLLGRAFDGVTTCFLLVVGALTVPKPYLLNQPLVDRAINQALKAAEKMWMVLGSKIGGTAATDSATAATTTATTGATAAVAKGGDNTDSSSSSASSAESKKNA